MGLSFRRGVWLGLAGFALVSISACLAQTPPTSADLAGHYVVDPTHASVSWKVSHFGLSNYTARFNRMTAEIDYNPADPTKSRVTASVDPTSLSTVNGADFDKQLQGDDWFNVAKYAAIRFKSTSIEKTSDKTGRITGDLTLLGVTKPVTFDVTMNGAFASHPMMKIPVLGFSATATIKRSDFGMAAYVPLIGDEVTIQIEAEFQKK